VVAAAGRVRNAEIGDHEKERAQCALNRVKTA
jgi:hypothetical protein